MCYFEALHLYMCMSFASIHVHDASLELHYYLLFHAGILRRPIRPQKSARPALIQPAQPDTI